MGRIRGVVDSLITLCAVASASAVAILLLQHRSTPHVGAMIARNPLDDTVRVPDWKDYAKGGHRIGAKAPVVTIVMFTDFQCPFCRRFYSDAVKPILARYPDQVAVVVQHFPLGMHALAYSAARAAECAAAQGRFEVFEDKVYEAQDSLATLPFSTLATRSGVPDLAEFEACDRSDQPVEAIDSGAARARRLGGTGTPLVLVNDLKFTGSIDRLALEGLVKSAFPLSWH